MKKVSILDKSTLSRHLTTTTTNSNSNSNFENENINGNVNISNIASHKFNNIAASENGKDFNHYSQSTNQDTFPISTFNSHLYTRTTTTTSSNPSSTRLTVIPNSFSSPRRHMYSKAADRSIAINERIERMARKWTSLDSSPCSYDQLSHPSRASPETIITVGRIVCDSDAKLNENSVLLESSREIGSGVRIPLNLSSVPSYSLFPGQIVMLEGVNSDGKCLHVQKFIQPGNSLMKIPKLTEGYGNYENLVDGVLSVLVSSGPYTVDTSSVRELDYSPLNSLLSVAISKRPEVLILSGPFVDSENSAIKAGGLCNFPDQIFQMEIILRLNEFHEKCPETRIILIPSLKDLHSSSEYIYPQPPLTGLKFESPMMTCLSNPTMFFVNEICFSIGINEILLPLAQQSIARSHLDRITRISGHLLEQSSLYPLMPAAQSANLDFSLLDQLEFPFTPDLIISPSSLGAFARVIDSTSGTVCINPGYFCRKNGLGTAALLSFNPPKLVGEGDCVSERLRVDFVQF